MENLILDKINKEIENILSLEDLALLYNKCLGNKGFIKQELKNIQTLPIQKRKQEGQELNELRNKLSTLFQEKEKSLNDKIQEKTLKDQAEELDFLVPKIGHLHPLTHTIRRINNIFTNMGYSVVEGPEIETDEYCLQRLNVPEDHPARDMQDTLYIKSPSYLLRSQTSSVEARILESHNPPLRFVIPGKVYRNEKVNKSNHFIFYQYQGVVVDENVTLKDLFGTFEHLFRNLYGSKAKFRFRNKYYPEVEPGVGPDMQCFNCNGKGCTTCKFVGWIEMGGGGIIHPKVLEMAGINSNKHKGFAFGLGLDRWVMAKYNISDIRTLLGGNLVYKYHENENNL